VKNKEVLPIGPMRKKYPTSNEKTGRRANSIGHSLRTNCLLQHVIEGKVEGRSDGKTRKKT
jgi:hypothetical protein